MTALTETFHNWGFMVSEAQGTRSREQITLLSGQNLKAGTVLGKRLTGAGASAAFAANTGNGAMGAITVTGPAKAGVHKLIIIEPGANVGTFEVFDPDGLLIGRGAVASAFSAQGIAFTLADGGTDFVAGDGFDITVTATAVKYLAYDPTQTTGEQIAAVILGQDTDASAADTQTSAAVRDCEFNKSELVWGAGVTTQAHKDAAYAVLAEAGAIGR